MNIIEIILIIIILIIILFFYLGINIIGNFSKKESKLTFSFKILIFSKIKVYSITYPRNKDKKDDEKEDKKQRNITLELIEPCIGSFLEFSKSFFKSLTVRKLEGHMDFGLDNYVKTAKYVGYMWAFLTFPNTTLKNTSLSVTPVFSQSIIDFNLTIDIKIKLLKLIIPTIKLISNKNVFNLIKELIK